MGRVKKSSEEQLRELQLKKEQILKQEKVLKNKVAKDKRARDNHWKYTFGGAVFAIFGKDKLLSENDARAFQQMLYDNKETILEYISEYNKLVAKASASINPSNPDPKDSERAEM